MTNAPTPSPFIRNRQFTAIGVLPDWIAEPRLAEPHIRNFAEMGYAALYIFPWMTDHKVDSRPIHDAVKAMVAYGQGLGLKMLLETCPDRWSNRVVERHPEAACWAIGSVEAGVYSGRFEFQVIYPRLKGFSSVHELSAVFIPAGEDYRHLPGADCRYAVHRANCDDKCVIQGELKEPYSGSAVFYVTVRDYGIADFAHPVCLKAQDELLDFYADIPLDGFAWDEPGKGMGDLRWFKAGAGFVELFETSKGYALRPHLIYLDHLEGTAKATRVRCDYYHALNEMNYSAQKRHNDYAQSTSSKKLIFGTHHTWSGFPSDLVGGCLDYFRHGTLLTAAWTDGGCNQETKVGLHNFMLAEGLKKELQRRDAYFNEWTFRFPGIGDMGFADRAKLLFHVNSYPHGIMELFEKDRAAAIQSREMLDRFDELVGDRFAPHTDVAYLYSWDTLAASPKWMSRAFSANMFNASIHLTDAGLYAAIMSGESIRRATIGEGCFTVNGLTYRVLVAPYINVVAEDVYRKIMRIAEAGVPVIVVGPPPEFTTEGNPIAADFAGRCGFEPFSLRQYIAAVAEQSPLPKPNEWEPSWLDATYPARTTTGQVSFDQELKLRYVKADGLPLYYMPLIDPREELTNLIAELTTPLVETFAEGTYYRFFPHRDEKDDMVVVAVAKAHVASFGLAPDKEAFARGGGHGAGAWVRPPIRPRFVKALFRLQGGELVVRGGTWRAVRVKNGQVVECLGDSTELTWNDADVAALKATETGSV